MCIRDRGKGIWKSKEEFSNPYNWSGYVVGQILSKPEYMGLSLIHI